MWHSCEYEIKRHWETLCESTSDVLFWLRICNTVCICTASVSYSLNLFIFTLSRWSDITNFVCSRKRSDNAWRKISSNVSFKYLPNFCGMPKCQQPSKKLKSYLGSFQILVKETIFFLAITLSNYTKQVFCETPDAKHKMKHDATNNRSCIEVLYKSHCFFCSCNVANGSDNKKRYVSVKHSLLIWKHFAWKAFAI